MPMTAVLEDWERRQLIDYQQREDEINQLKAERDKDPDAWDAKFLEAVDAHLEQRVAELEDGGDSTVNRPKKTTRSISRCPLPVAGIRIAQELSSRNHGNTCN